MCKFSEKNIRKWEIDWKIPVRTDNEWTENSWKRKKYEQGKKIMELNSKKKMISMPLNYFQVYLLNLN